MAHLLIIHIDKGLFCVICVTGLAATHLPQADCLRHGLTLHLPYQRLARSSYDQALLKVDCILVCKGPALVVLCQVLHCVLAVFVTAKVQHRFGFIPGMQLEIC